MNLPKVITADQIRQADLFTIKNEPISSIDLMERAVSAYLSGLLEYIHKKDNILVLCGCGNNGGDGLTLARNLIDMGFKTNVYLVKYGELTEDAQTNFDQLPDVKVYEPDGFTMMNDYDVIVDALFGSGLNRIIDGDISNWIDAVNVTKARKFSIDLPSGLFADGFNEKGAKIKADYTFTFGRPKKSFFDQRSYKYTGEWAVLDIGLNEDFIQSQDSIAHHLDASIEKVLKPKDKFSHKGNYGKGMLIGGSKGMIGAALLSAKACLKSGIGLLAVMTPSRGETTIQSQVPEALWIDGGEDINSVCPDLSSYNALGIGPGLSTDHKALSLLTKILENFDGPVVIDADAINLVSYNHDLVSKLPDGSVFTPHPKELERLVGKFKNDEEKWCKQVAFSIENKVVLLVKGAYTSISDPDGNIYWNTNGNPGMAKGGSGDVLTGMILAFLAQGHTSTEATLLACYEHGKAGDLAKARFGEHQMIARDIIDHITF